MASRCQDGKQIDGKQIDGKPESLLLPLWAWQRIGHRRGPRPRYSLMASVTGSIGITTLRWRLRAGSEKLYTLGDSTANGHTKHLNAKNRGGIIRRSPSKFSLLCWKSSAARPAAGGSVLLRANIHLLAGAERVRIFSLPCLGLRLVPTWVEQLTTMAGTTRR